MLILDLIIMILLSAGPAFLYLYLLYQFVPKNTVNPKVALNYLLFGCLSPALIILLHFIFPNYTNQLNGSILFSFAALCYVQIGLTEELSKYALLKLVSNDDATYKKSSMINVIVYSLMISTGFAISENMLYLFEVRRTILNETSLFLCQGINSTPLEIQINIIKSMVGIAALRAISAVVMHMVCGLILGYFVAKIHYKKNSLKKYSNFNYWYYTAAGILAAATYHGIYDMNILLPQNNWMNYFHLVNMLFGLMIGYLIIGKVIKRRKTLNKNNLTTYNENETGG